MANGYSCIFNKSIPPIEESWIVLVRFYGWIIWLSRVVAVWDGYSGTYSIEILVGILYYASSSGILRRYGP